MDTDFEELLRAELRATRTDLADGADELVRYMAERAAHLTTLAGQPGFHRAVVAERNAVALKAGLDATLQAEAADARIVGVITGILMGVAKG